MLPFVVDSVATKYGVEEFECDANAVANIIDLSIAYASSTFSASKSARKSGSVLPIVDGPLKNEGCCATIMRLIPCRRLNKSSLLLAYLSV